MVTADELRQVLQQVDELGNKCAQAYHRAATAEQKAKELGDADTALQLNYQNLQRELDTHRGKYTDLQQTYTEVVAQQSTLESKLRETSAELDQKNTAYAALESKYTAEKQQLEGAIAELHGVVEEKDATIGDLTNQMEQYAMQDQENDALLQQIKAKLSEYLPHN